MEDQQLLAAELLQQEQALQFVSFGNQLALDAGLRLIEAAKRADKPIAVDISRNGAQLFFHAMAGTSPDHIEWIARKNRVVQRYSHSSLYMGACYRARGTIFEAHTGLDPRVYAAVGGAFPMLLKGGICIGTITVSGLSQEQDHALVVDVLRQLAGH